MKPLTRKMLWTTTTVALLALTPACGDDDVDAPACGEPLYGGDATDEAWRALVDAKGRPVDSSQAVTLSLPTSDTTYATNDAPPRWTWTSPLASALPRPSPASPARAPGALDVGRTLLARLGGFVLPSAHAHLPPFTGDIYHVQVLVPGRECPVEMLTSNLEWQLDAATWDLLKAHPAQDLGIQVVSAYLLQNRITEGPYQLATPVTFRIQGAP
ncbi:hypothetical protein LZ198_41225 [Myxococcus sp. K15C18031901]|uniref:hypothetical protein n=1 Tax=Myxococcus dinghuensis TaxID=2906761 RepID=UPI0020A7888E|nr:hypothetical protein [Myxococcus dinghuensis]MCP3105310.1 hypothetical protein [Myxococcus dinghuensis]